MKELDQSLVIVVLAHQKAFSLLVYCIIVMHVISQTVVISLVCSPAAVVVSTPPPTTHTRIHTPSPANLPLPPPPQPLQRKNVRTKHECTCQIESIMSVLFAVKDNL